MFVTFLSKLLMLSINALFVSKILACSSMPDSNLSKATFEELIKEEFSELVDRVAEEAVNQIIEGLNNENLEQSTDEIVTTN